jgi:hypothetical protein
MWYISRQTMHVEVETTIDHVAVGESSAYTLIGKQLHSSSYSCTLLTTTMRQASPLDESLTQHMYNLCSALQCPSHTLDVAHSSHPRAVAGGNKHRIIISLNLDSSSTTACCLGTTRREPPIARTPSNSQAINYRRNALSRTRDLKSRGRTGSMWLLELEFRICPAVCLQPRRCRENTRKKARERCKTTFALH